MVHGQSVQKLHLTAYTILSLLTSKRSLKYIGIYVHHNLNIKVNLNINMKKIKILFILNFAKRCDLVAI